LPLDSLALYFPFDEGAGDTVKDNSKNGNNGKLEKGAKWADGKFGKALDFDGTKQQFVLVPTSKSLQINEQVTISVWVKWNDAPGDGWLTITANGTQGGPWENYGLFINRGERYFYFTLSLNAVGNHVVTRTPGGEAKPGEWQHVLASYEGKTRKIFVNGKQALDAPEGGKLVAGNQDLRIGHRFGSPHWYNGLIDELAIFSKAITDEKDVAILVKDPISQALFVSPAGKLATSWANIKSWR
jgi:hypothetical protein